MTVCVPCSAALAFVVFGLIVVYHIVKVGRRRCSGHLCDRPSGVGRQRRSAVQTFEDIHRTPSRKSRGFESRGALYAMRRAVVGMVECAIISGIMMRMLVAHGGGGTGTDLQRW